MNKNKVVKYLGKERSGEVYLFCLISVVTLILGILILTGYLDVKADAGLVGEYPTAFAWILVGISSAGVIHSIFKIRKILMYKKNSVYYVIKDMEKDTIINKLSLLSSDRIEVDNLSSSFYVSLYYGTMSFNLELTEDEVSMYIDGYDDLDLSDEELEKLDDVSLSLDPLKTDKDEVFSKFISFVNNNLDMVTSYGER